MNGVFSRWLAVTAAAFVMVGATLPASAQRPPPPPVPILVNAVADLVAHTLTINGANMATPPVTVVLGNVGTIVLTTSS